MPRAPAAAEGPPIQVAGSPWAREAQRVLAAFAESGRVPYTKRVLARWAACASVPLCCAPCCAWSFFARLLLCPYQCAVNGPSLACSDNRCTRVSDGCIETACEQAWHRVRLPPVPLPSPSPTQEQDMEEIARALRDTMEVLAAVRSRGGVYTVEHYRLTDALFKATLGSRCHPSAVLTFIEKRLLEITAAAATRSK